MSDDTAVKVINLTKQFRIPVEPSSGIKQKLINTLKGRKGYRNFTPLKGISFEIKKGEFFGIVGRNGSGKSTLLKTIAGIYEPQSGQVQVNGSLVPFIELGVGFNPELTGRENVFLNGALLGFSHAEMKTLYDDIVEFAELEKFMDERLKNYSSGMQVRLAFSIAIRAKSDILLLDEVLAVGDEAFQRKCNNYFAQLKREKRTVILVTHSMDSVQQYCTRAMMIDKGKIVKIGKTSEVAQMYRELFIDEQEKAVQNEETIASENKNLTARVTYKKIDEHLDFEVKISPKVDIDDAVLTFLIHKDEGGIVYRWVSDEKLSEKVSIKKNKDVYLDLKINNIFPNGVFNIEVGIKNRDRSVIYANFVDIKQFEIVNKGSHDNDIFWKPGEESKLRML